MTTSGGRRCAGTSYGRGWWGTVVAEAMVAGGKAAHRPARSRHHHHGAGPRGGRPHPQGRGACTTSPNAARTHDLTPPLAELRSCIVQGGFRAVRTAGPDVAAYTAPLRHRRA